MPNNNDRYDYVNLESLESNTQTPIEPVVEDKDEAPKGNESIWGLILGLGYVTILTIIPLYIIIFIFGSPTTSAQESTISSIAQMITAVGVLIAMGFISKRVFRTIMQGFTGKAFLQGIKYAVLVYIAAIVMSYLDIFIFGENVETNANQSSIEELMMAAPFLGALFTCIIAPLIEEVIFRYYLFKTISKRNTVLAFVISGVTFGAIHLMSSVSALASDGDMATFLNDLRSLPAYIVAGLLFCYVYYKTQKLSVSVFAHMIYNTIVTIFMIISIRSMPLKIIDVQTQDTSISFSLNVNSSTGTSVTRIELYSADQLEQTISGSLANYENIVFDDLATGTTYSIVVVYQYEEMDLTGQVEVVEDTISTYAVAYEN